MRSILLPVFAVVLLFAALLFVGCVTPRGGGGGGGGDTPPTTGWEGVCTVRPIIVTDGGQSRWSDARVGNYTRWLNLGYGNANLTFHILPSERLESPEWYIIDEKADFYAMAEVSMSRSREAGEMVAWFVDGIPAWGAGGLAQYPSNLLGSFQHGIAISMSSSEASLMHEIGHAFNLPHAWKDGFTDTPTTGSADCSSEPCNAMTYCFDRRLPQGACLGETFSKQQVSEVQKWASAAPRNQVVVAKNVPPGVFVTYTDNTEPEID